MQATQTKQRITFRNILYATDFSTAAQEAMPFAAELAKSFGAKFYAMHVNEPVNYAVPPEMWESTQLAYEERKKALRFELNRDFPGILPKFLEATGDVATEVAEAVEKQEIDLLVLGTRGRTGLGKAILGSKAEEILRKTKCAVLTVGPQAYLEKERTGLASILCATQFGPASVKAAGIAVSLAEEYQSKLILLTVLQPRDTNQPGPREEFGETSERELRKLVPEEAHLWCTPHFLVERGNPAERILEVARGTKADLIVLGAHRAEGVAGAATHLPTATIHQVIAHAECPVLTIRG